tara:strand:- start:7044 stop:7802 length:759 start_codon:yes stop_codon:yes gene_type:complete
MSTDYLNDKISSVSLVDRFITDAPLKTVNSARISYNKVNKQFEEKDGKLTTFLWNNEHTSPFRHTYLTFHVKGPLFLFRQLMKYQVGSGFRSYEVNGQEVKLEIFDHFYDTDKGCSWNELSGRYVEMRDEFYIPMKARKNPPHGNKQASVDFSDDDTTHQWMFGTMANACWKALDTYEKLLANGVAKEIARMVLPQNIYSESYWTLSLQAIIHFLHQRLKPDAQFEIRCLAEAVYELVKDDLNKMGLTKENL